MRIMLPGCFIAAAAVAAMLSACGGSDEPDTSPAVDVPDTPVGALPDRYGLYAVQGDHIGRLNGDQNFEVSTWEHRQSLRPDVAFIVYDRRLADPSLALDQVIHLQRVPHVRNEVSPSGMAAPATANNWVAVDLPKFAVPIDFEPVSTSPQMVRVIPSRPLEPGLYSLEIRTANSALTGRFGVEWDKVDKARYSASYCVDRYTGASASYRGCGDAAPMAQLPPSGEGQLAPSGQLAPAGAAPPPAPALQPGAALQVRDVQAVRRNDGSMTTLLVQGVVVNASQTPQFVPQLVASLRDQQGQEVKRWEFTTEVTQLMPGRSTGFRTEVLDTSTGPTQVSIAFPGTSSAMQ